MRVAVHGVTYRVRAAGAGPPLLLLHGFTGTGLTWAPLMPALSQRFRAVAPDLLGHGETGAPLDPARYRMERCVADLLALLDALGIERCHVLGYSMGGRVALHLALAAPARVATLVLEGASPGIADPQEREARRRQDEALAAFIEREGVPAFVERWEKLPLFASQERLPPAVRAAVRAQRLQHTAVGLANSLRGMGAGAQEPLVDRLGSLAMPCLLVAGELDEKYRGLVAVMAERLPRAETAVVPGAGHNVHLERPEAFLARVLAFWDQHIPGDPEAGQGKGVHRKEVQGR
ncbi:MAG TPA: 2-succinyl-6-hydroxy-2,4-cyclohexadiene-1-carboxylate synthase [Limnochordales bacterium]|nr:2-succinyl-6-hydroxy-2,4-cyclohexadiene-1-carboxylate synthase [Limnochordales bacterium]